MMKKNKLPIFVLVLVVVICGIYYYAFGVKSSSDHHHHHHHHHDITSAVISSDEVNPIVNIDAPLHEYENLILFIQIVAGLLLFGIAFYFLKKSRNK